MSVDLTKCAEEWDMAGYLWTLHDDSAGGEDGGFETLRYKTEENELTFQIDAVGKFEVRVEFMGEDGNLYPSADPYDRGSTKDKWGVSGYAPRSSIHSVYVKEDQLPRDGRAYHTLFDTFCCPWANDVRITKDDSSAVGTNWEVTFLVDRTDEVIWESGDSKRPLGSDYENVLGTKWSERIRVVIEPREEVSYPGHVLPQYSVEVRIGPNDQKDGFERA